MLSRVAFRNKPMPVVVVVWCNHSKEEESSRGGSQKIPIRVEKKWRTVSHFDVGAPTASPCRKEFKGAQKASTFDSLSMDQESLQDLLPNETYLSLATAWFRLSAKPSGLSKQPHPPVQSSKLHGMFSLDPPVCNFGEKHFK